MKYDFYIIMYQVPHTYHTIGMYPIPRRPPPISSAILSLAHTHRHSLPLITRTRGACSSTTVGQPEREGGQHGGGPGSEGGPLENNYGGSGSITKRV